MYIEKVLEKLAEPQQPFPEEPSPEELAAQKARRSRAWEIGQTIFAHAEADEAFWSQFTIETSEDLHATGGAGGILASMPETKVTTTVTRSRWVDYNNKAETQVALIDQRGTSYGLGKLLGKKSWNSLELNLNIRTPRTDEAVRYAELSNGGALILPALTHLRSPGWTRAMYDEAETEALQALEATATFLGAQPTPATE